jgi:hypothetical protein
MDHDNIIVYDLTSSMSFWARYNHKLQAYQYFLEHADNMILDKMFKLYFSPMRGDDKVYEFESALGEILFKAP